MLFKTRVTEDVNISGKLFENVEIFICSCVISDTGETAKAIIAASDILLAMKSFSEMSGFHATAVQRIGALSSMSAWVDDKDNVIEMVNIKADSPIVPSHVFLRDLVSSTNKQADGGFIANKEETSETKH